MAVGILLVTHDEAGETLIKTARAVLGGKLPLEVEAAAVPLSRDPDAAAREIRDRCRALDSGDGVLILTDLHGSTPCNISAGCHQAGAVHIVSGVNLPMLMKIINYHALDLVALTGKALAGGRDGIAEVVGR